MATVKSSAGKGGARRKSSAEIYSFWELMGATTGPTRGELAHRITAMGRNGWDLAINLSSIGSDGHWPHSMAVFRFANAGALEKQLKVGFADGMDERDLKWAKMKLATKLRGDLDTKHRSWLFEYVRFGSAEALAAHQGPDLLFAELYAPWQGIAMWGADSLRALMQRELKGIGSVGKPGVLQATGWWTTIPERVLV